MSDTVIRQAIQMIESQDLTHWSDAHDRVTLAALKSALAAPQPEPQPVKQATTTSGHCHHHKGPRGCQLHNLQCGYPACDIKTKEAKP